MAMGLGGVSLDLSLLLVLLNDVIQILVDQYVSDDYLTKENSTGHINSDHLDVVVCFEFL